MKLAIVMPVLNEGEALLPALQALQNLRARGVRLVLVDGGSHDETARIAQPYVDRIETAPRGRASQMNAGALVCRDADALVFLHADTRLPADADRLIAHALQSRAWGRFDVRIDGQSRWLQLVGAMMNVRSRLSGLATGDQAMFVRRRFFEQIGSFEAMPLMEDLDLSRRLKTVSPPACLSARVGTSGRRWDTHGVWRTVWLMWRLRAAGYLGAEPRELARQYGYEPRADAAVAVLAKAPVPGLAKTRLIPAAGDDGHVLGRTGAARAQRRFTLRTLAIARAAAIGRITLWCAPDADHVFFRSLRRRFGVRCGSQAAGDLGQRLQAVGASHFKNAPNVPLLIVGTDCPVLTPAHLQQAADALQTHDAVLIPAEDGGYVLIGLRRELTGVFERIDWSTSGVMAQTRERLKSMDASWHELAPLWDVDTPADWARWQDFERTAS